MKQFVIIIRVLCLIAAWGFVFYSFGIFFIEVEKVTIKDMSMSLGALGIAAILLSIGTRGKEG